MPHSVGLTLLNKKLDLIGKSESITNAFNTHRTLMLDAIAMPHIFYAQADATLRYVETIRADSDVLYLLMNDDERETSADSDTLREFRWKSLVEVKFWWDKELGAAPWRKISNGRRNRIRRFGGVFANFPDYPFKEDPHYAFLKYMHDTPQAAQYANAGYRTFEEVKACVDNDLDMEIIRSLG